MLILVLRIVTDGAFLLHSTACPDDDSLDGRRRPTPPPPPCICSWPLHLISNRLSMSSQS